MLNAGSIDKTNNVDGLYKFSWNGKQRGIHTVLLLCDENEEEDDDDITWRPDLFASRVETFLRSLIHSKGSRSNLRK
jgi:hypothetical protein